MAALIQKYCCIFFKTYPTPVFSREDISEISNLFTRRKYPSHVSRKTWLPFPDFGVVAQHQQPHLAALRFRCNVRIRADAEGHVCLAQETKTPPNKYLCCPKKKKKKKRALLYRSTKFFYFNPKYTLLLSSFQAHPSSGLTLDNHSTPNTCDSPISPPIKQPLYPTPGQSTIVFPPLS